MKTLKRALAVLLVAAMLFAMNGTCIAGFGNLFFAKADAAESEMLKENADGSFRILQFSDIQDNSFLSAKAFATLRLAVRKYNPNLIVLTGDNILNCKGDDVFHTTVDSLVSEFKDASGNAIPFAVTFGNHDYEVNYHDEDKTSKISLKDQYEYYLSKGAVPLLQEGLNTSAVSETAADNSATLYGTGYIDVYTNDGSDVARRVILLNTGSYDNDMTNRNRFARVGYNAETGEEESYANVVSAVNTWTSAENGAGEMIKCMVYQHIALQEVYLGDSPATSILTKPTVAGSITHACYGHILNDTITVNPDNPTGGRRQYVVSNKNPTLTGTFDEAPKCSYNSTKELFVTLAKDNVIGIFYGHDHGNTVCGQTKITYDGVQYTLTQGFGGGIDVYDGNYKGIDPQGSCYVIDRDGDFIKESFTYTGLLTEDVSYPSGDKSMKYIQKVALFCGSTFEDACNQARKAGYIPVTRAFSEGYNYADLNSNDRGSPYFSGNGNQYECIAYRQTTDPEDAVTDLRVYVTADDTYSRLNQTKTYTLNGKESLYTIVGGCNGNVNYGVSSNPSCAFLYYSKSKNAGSPLTELIVEVQESSYVDAYRQMDHRAIQIGNFTETFGTNGISSFSNVRIANMNLGSNRDKVVGDSVYLFLKRYDGCSGYNTKYSYETTAAVPETIYTESGSRGRFQSYVNYTAEGNGAVTSRGVSATGELYFWCPDAVSVTVSAMGGAGKNAATLASCTIENNRNMVKQANGVFYAKITGGEVSGMSAGSCKTVQWVFHYTVAGSSAAKTQIAFSAVVAAKAGAGTDADKSALRAYINNFNQSAVVKDAATVYNGENGFAAALANAAYVCGNPAATQEQVDGAKADFAWFAEKTGALYVPETPCEDAQTLMENCGGYIYGVCQPIDTDMDTIADTGLNWVRFDIPCPFDKGGYNNGNIKYVRNEYKKFKARCQAYHEKGFKILAVTPYPKDLIADMSLGLTTQNINEGDNFADFLDVATDVATYIYNDLRNNADGIDYVDIFQITNEMGIATFTHPLSIAQAAAYIGVQLQAIDGEKAKNGDEGFPIGYNCADLSLTSRKLIDNLNPYLQYCNYVAIDLYTGNQGDATAKDYVKKVKDLHGVTQKPVIITEFGFWSEGGQKTAEQKVAILYDNYGYSSEAQAIADGQNFLDKLPEDFIDTLTLNYSGQEADWPSLVFGKYSNHFYGETSPYTMNDVAHTPEGQAEYFRQVMTELKKVNCLAGLIIYSWQDKEKCFNCGHSWCPYETKFGITNFDGTVKPAVGAIKELIADFKAADSLKAQETATDYNAAAKTSVSVYHRYGNRALSADVGEIFGGCTVITGAKSIPGYASAQSATVQPNVTAPFSEHYSAYTPVSYTATLNNNGTGTAVSFQIDGADLVLNAPRKDGYIFAGWKVTEVAGDTLAKTDFIKNKVYAPGTYGGMYGDVTMEAQWQAKDYTVTFDVSNGGSVGTSSKTVVFGDVYGTLPSAIPPEGKIFAGWFTAKTGGTPVNAQTVYQFAGNQTLFAHYGCVYYDVGYDNLFLADKWNEGVNGACERATSVYDPTEKSIALTSFSTSTDSYTSLDESRYTMPAEGGQTYVFTAEVTANSGATLRPLARALNSGNTSLAVKELGQVNVSAGETYVYYKEWTVPADTAKVAIRFGTTTGGVTVTYKNIRFVKKSVADKNITYPVNTQTFLDGTPYTDLAIPTRAGYVFDGWYSDAECTAGNEITPNMLAADHITAYSKWTKLSEVTYDNLFSFTEYAASKSVTLNEISGTAVTDGENGSVTVPGNPDSTGGSPYTSWSTGTGYYTIPVTGGKKYYLSFYNSSWGGNVFVNFDSGTATDTNMAKNSGTTYIGGVLSGNAAKQYTFYFTAPASATKIGLRFGASGTEPRTYSNIVLIDEARYYADSAYESRTGYVAQNTAYGTLQTPTRAGYSFAGWYTENGVKITADSATCSENVKLFSKWEKSYDVMYNSFFDFDQWGQKAKTAWSNAAATVDFGANTYTIVANSNSSSEATSEGTGGGTNGSNVYAMPVVPNHQYKVFVDIAADASNAEDKQYNIFIFEYDTLQRIQNYERIGDSSKTFTVAPGTKGTYSLLFTAVSDANYIALRLALKSSGASKGTFSNIRIQDMTATPYPEAFVQTNAMQSDSLIAQPQREGYFENGWYDTVSAQGVVSGTHYTSAASLTGNQILYAKYSEKSYTVTYINPVGTTGRRELAYGADPTAAYTPDEKVGYIFEGWYADEERLTFAPLTVTENLTLYAKWSEDVRRITWRLNGRDYKQTLRVGDALQIPALPIPVGYQITQWSPAVPDTVPAEDTCYVAALVAEVYSLTFVADNEVLGSLTYTVENTDITPPAVPKKEGKFNGRWSRYDLSKGGNLTVTAVYEDALVSLIPQKTLFVGDSTRITAQANFTVTGKTFACNNESVATVDQRGRVNVTGAGECTITVTVFGLDDFGNMVCADGNVTLIALEKNADATQEGNDSPILQKEESAFRTAFLNFFRTSLRDGVAFLAYLLRALALVQEG